jgi:hypothetical protein
MLADRATPVQSFGVRPEAAAAKLALRAPANDVPATASARCKTSGSLCPGGAWTRCLHGGILLDETALAGDLVFAACFEG